MDKDENGRCKAFLDYWCMRLNRAFVNGWFGAKGVSSWPDNNYYLILNELYRKWTGDKLEDKES